ncbi:MAG TPA: family 43 glycosylhydrolase [Vicinamibacteria bacterium]|nr:family 43 glycosylhydrolase [Vicinamibacteria bacterium]
MLSLAPLLLLLSAQPAVPAAPGGFEPGAVWLDTEGKPIQAHGGGVLYDKGTYYWFGENKDAANTTSASALLARIDAVGISCYSSKDLVRWKHEGVVLPAVKGDPDLEPGGIIERPKVVFNKKTKKYVMWLHIDSADYQKAHAGVAVADRPTGPYRYLGSLRPDGGDSRDMTLFQDDDGRAYLVYSSEWNKTMHVSLLSDDYLKPVGRMVRIFEGQSREAPALFKRGGLYYLVTSGCTGWYPNRAVYATAPKVTGPWTVQGNPLLGPDAEWTYFGQSAHVLPVAGWRDAFVLLLDRWKSTNLRDSRYLWLPVRFQGTRMVVEWWDRWDLSVFDRPGAVSPATARFAPLRIGERETIVFYGDSITEQNLYSAYLETFLLSRFPQKKLATFNFGWGGDTASGGNKRFARDVAGVRPSLVFVDFGMNDGGYKAYDEPTYRNYLDAQQALADTVKAAGAREVLFTTSPIDDVRRGDKGVYNETLSRMAWGVVGLANERQLPVIDLLHPMVELQRLAKEKEPAFTMIPDTVHPDPAGHLVMAYLAMRQIEAPRSVGEIAVDGAAVTARDGATVANVAAVDGSVEFDLNLPFLPFYVPQEARKALELVPLEDDLNRFRLQAKVPAGESQLVLSVDGKTLGSFKAEELARGVDLALLDNAPWTQAGRTLWEAAQYRWKTHFEAWRQMGLDKPAAMMPTLASFGPHARAQRAYADEMGRALGELARPRPYHLRLSAPGAPVPITSVELSPLYPFDSFDAPLPPEKDTASVAWARAPFTDGQIDLGKHFSGANNVIAYARVVLEADQPTLLHLFMGSDDGLAVFAGGRRVFACDVMRSLKPGEDEADVPLAAGRNELLFKVTQGGGGFALAVDAQVRGQGRVRQVLP